MNTKRHSTIAAEGVPLMLLTALATVAAFHWLGWAYSLVAMLLLIWQYFLFRDPVRRIPAEPAAILSPCDGRIVSIDLTDEGVLIREAMRISIAVDHMGAYTIRSPVEGWIFDPRDNVKAGSKRSGTNGLWVRTDADDDVVTVFRGPPLLGVPVSFVRYGERVGQGQRCGNLRLARRALVLAPNDVRVLVKVGDRVEAGTTTLARFRYD